MKPQRCIAPPYDLHLHTMLSPCGARHAPSNAPALYAARAAELAIETIGISDHFALRLPWISDWYADCGPAMIDKGRELAGAVTGMRVLVGCEADLVASGRVTIDAAYAREVDYVIVAASHFDDQNIQAEAADDARLAAAYLTAYLDEAVDLPFSDVIAHPLAVPEQRLGDPARYMEHIADKTLRRIARKAAANSVAFELNGRVASREDYRVPMRRFFEIARAEGVRFTVGSDAHHVAAMDRHERIESYARELGLRREDFASLEDVLARHAAS